MENPDNGSGKQKIFNAKNRKKAIVSLAVILISILFFFILYKMDQVGKAITSITSILAPVLYGIAIAYLLNPLVERMRNPLHRFLSDRMQNKKRAAGIAKGVSITVAVLFALVVVTVLLWLIIPQLFDSISKLIEAMPEQIKKVQTWYNTEVQSGTEWAQVVKNYLDKGLEALNKWLSTDLMNAVNGAVSYLTSSVIGFVSFIVNLLIGIVVAVYALIEKDIFVGQAKKLTYALFKPERANSIIETARHGDKIFGGFLSGKILDKCSTMDRTRAVFADCGNMSRRSIALMTGKTVFRVDFIVLTHHPVPGYFGKDAGGCDGYALGVAFDNRNLRDAYARNGNCIVQ